MTKLLACVAALALLVACSSSEGPASGSDAGSDAGDGGAAADGAPTGPCTAEKQRVPEDDTGVCCAGLFKACVGIGYGGRSRCICSTVECGTATAQPPPNVPCCLGIAMHCELTLGGDSDAVCKCGP